MPSRLDLPARRVAWLRWIALAVVVANVAFNYLYDRIDWLALPSIGEQSARVHAMFTPAPYTFAIWGLVYFAFVAFAVWELAADARGQRLDRLAKPLIVVNVLASLWIVVFGHGLLGLSVLVIATMCAAGASMYVHTRTHVNGWVAAAFSLFFAWICVATLSASALWLADLGFTGGPLGENAWTALLALMAGALGAWMALRYNDPVYPLVIAWAIFGVHIATERVAQPASVSAMLVAIAMLAFAAWAAIRAYAIRNPGTTPSR
jgi:hypothetical protein